MIEVLKQALEAFEIAAEGGGVNFHAYAEELRQAIAELERRTWVGLTNEDDIDWDGTGNLKQLVEAVEAKLKEKNSA